MMEETVAKREAFSVIALNYPKPTGASPGYRQLPQGNKPKRKAWWNFTVLANDCVTKSFSFENRASALRLRRLRFDGSKLLVEFTRSLKTSASRVGAVREMRLWFDASLPTTQ